MSVAEAPVAAAATGQDAELSHGEQIFQRGLARTPIQNAAGAKRKASGTVNKTATMRSMSKTRYFAGESVTSVAADRVADLSHDWQIYQRGLV